MRLFRRRNPLDDAPRHWAEEHRISWATLAAQSEFDARHRTMLELAVLLLYQCRELGPDFPVDRHRELRETLECSPSQVHGYANPYRPGDGAFDSWIKAEKMVAEILDADADYFTRSPTTIGATQCPH